ncbi:hypothetical protein CANINC_001438 [Pichia inconspicua]|uniref:Uncharacterized protein n=1 Tax=Pichia inconspicua TaxID=52247 RepID=A0A4T0X4P4_9ASCO|nr:hypothetical protein CANINC_001438 [[Candida] inconspicua]
MSDEEFIVRHQEEEDVEAEVEVPEGEEEVFEDEFRVLVIANSSVSADENGETKVSIEQSDMDEIMLRQVRTLNDVNEFFDDFDAKIAQPNDGHLKYEVGSDGLCVVLVDTVKLKNEVVEFINNFIDLHPFIEEKEEVEKEDEDKERNTKRRR